MHHARASQNKAGVLVSIADNQVSESGRPGQEEGEGHRMESQVGYRAQPCPAHPHPGAEGLLSLRVGRALAAFLILPRFQWERLL